MQQYDAFIVAGGKSPWLLPVAGTEYRALVKIGQRRMLDYIIEALQSSGCVRRLVVAAADEALAQLQGTLPPNISLCRAEGDLSSTTVAAAQALGADSSTMLLGVCDDIPLLTGAAVKDFVTQCAAYPEGQLFYPIIPKDICLQRFPQAKRTYGKLQDGIFTGGNMMLMDKNIIPRGQEKAREIFARRKSPLRLGNWLGWTFIIKLLLHKLTVQEAEARTSQLLEMRCKAIISNYPEVGMDVDKPEDLQLAAAYLSK